MSLYGKVGGWEKGCDAVPKTAMDGFVKRNLIPSRRMTLEELTASTRRRQKRQSRFLELHCKPNSASRAPPSPEGKARLASQAGKRLSIFFRHSFGYPRLKSFCAHRRCADLPRLRGRGTSTRRNFLRQLALLSLVVVDEVPLTETASAVFDVGGMRSCLCVILSTRGS